MTRESDIHPDAISHIAKVQTNRVSNATCLVLIIHCSTEPPNPISPPCLLLNPSKPLSITSHDPTVPILHPSSLIRATIHCSIELLRAAIHYSTPRSLHRSSSLIRATIHCSNVPPPCRALHCSTVLLILSIAPSCLLLNPRSIAPPPSSFPSNYPLQRASSLIRATNQLSIAIPLHASSLIRATIHCSTPRSIISCLLLNLEPPSIAPPCLLNPSQSPTSSITPPASSLIRESIHRASSLIRAAIHSRDDTCLKSLIQTIHCSTAAGLNPEPRWIFIHYPTCLLLNTSHHPLLHLYIKLRDSTMPPTPLSLLHHSSPEPRWLNEIQYLSTFASSLIISIAPYSFNPTWIATIHCSIASYLIRGHPLKSTPP
ncbi:unnamed protein product [Acanthosepion pharaonis]|uniref:Uncharacterized protein n=1 Tax=Acanthosepion pharaonis TaxID=158019 RepID=A0A812B5E9_ACAPH|nr:unnamed protein product [Sepia pharaonis]